MYLHHVISRQSRVVLLTSSDVDGGDRLLIRTQVRTIVRFKCSRKPRSLFYSLVLRFSCRSWTAFHLCLCSISFCITVGWLIISVKRTCGRISWQHIVTNYLGFHFFGVLSAASAADKLNVPKAAVTRFIIMSTRVGAGTPAWGRRACNVNASRQKVKFCRAQRGQLKNICSCYEILSCGATRRNWSWNRNLITLWSASE